MNHQCLITVNIGDFLTEHSRMSFLKACGRWGCDFSMIHCPIREGYPSCSKLVSAKLYRGYKKIMILDSDTVISDHAPSPFELCVSEDVLYAVSDYQNVNQCDAWKDGPYKIGVESAIKVHPEWKRPPYDKFFNSGMLLCIPGERIIAMFRNAEESLPQDPIPFIEQGAINMAAFNSKEVTVSLLPETWNHMIPQDCLPVPEFYINHFGGWAHDMLKQISNNHSNQNQTHV